MGRIDLSEIHEQPWFPEPLRDGVTDGLQSIFRLGGVYRPVASRLCRAIETTRARRIVDLCSGAGGPWIWLHRIIAGQVSGRLSICLTDKYPNRMAFERAREASRGTIGYCAEPIDAANLPARLDGFRTMFTSFHHFSPDAVTAILQNAIDNRQGIAVFDAVTRHPRSILLTFLIPGAALLTPLFTRPFRLSRWVWTYLLPVIPLVLWCDGILSCLRAYAPDELWQIVSRLDARGYKWEVGEESGRLAPVTYLLGYPDRQNTAHTTEPIS